MIPSQYSERVLPERLLLFSVPYHYSQLALAHFLAQLPSRPGRSVGLIGTANEAGLDADRPAEKAS